MPGCAAVGPIAPVKQTDTRAAKDRGPEPSREDIDLGIREREEREQKAAAREALEREAKRLQAGIGGSVVGLLFLTRVLFVIEAPWLTLPITAGAVYLWVKFYRRIKEIRRETERQSVRSDEIDTMAENAVMPFKVVLILFAVFGGVALFLVLMIWGAKHLQ